MSIYTREVPIGVLIEQGFSEQEAKHITNNQPSVLWHELALQDGIAAVRALTDSEFDRIAVHLIAQGVPVDQAQDRARFISTVWTVAEDSCPKRGTPWYSQSLHSAAAAGLLLALVQDAFGKSEAEAAEQQSLNFARTLGVVQ